ncbi:MAG: hypothetical protein HONBIEJF_00557 [Fimbriimonadaceae bacterium]|nr:hypothetical protein [Fimbriimonadaceae bacterium]
MNTPSAAVIQQHDHAMGVIENPPSARRLMSSLRNLGYDSYRAVMDLIDNCLDADASEVVLDITGSRDKGDMVITVSDNGRGMDEATLKEALRLGSETEHDPTDLGAFGLGLVTASISQARRVEVLTRTANGPILAGGFDLDAISESNRFDIWLRPAEDGADRRPQGTVIRLLRIDSLSNWDPTTFANTLRKRVGQTYRKFLRAGVRIRIKGKLAEPIDPLMQNHSETEVVLDDTFVLDNDHIIAIKAVELPDLGLAGNTDLGITPRNAGFYVVRNNREIIAAESFDLFTKHAEVAHFRAEISFDGSLDGYFKVDVTKSRIDVANQAFIDKVKEVCQTLVKQSALRKRRRANVSRGGLDHRIAEDMISRKSKLIPKPPALLEKREPRRNQGTHSQGDGAREREPRHQEFKTPTGLKVVFEEGEYGDAGYYQVKQDRSTVIITYNREHPFWRELVAHSDDPKVIALLDYITFGLCMTHLMMPESAEAVKQQLNATLWALLA